MLVGITHTQRHPGNQFIRAELLNVRGQTLKFANCHRVLAVAALDKSLSML